MALGFKSSFNRLNNALGSVAQRAWGSVDKVRMTMIAGVATAAMTMGGAAYAQDANDTTLSIDPPTTASETVEAPSAMPAETGSPVLTAPAPAAEVAAPAGALISAADVETRQALLKVLYAVNGDSRLNPGPIDGIDGNRTQAATEYFLEANQGLLSINPQELTEAQQAEAFSALFSVGAAHPLFASTFQEGVENAENSRYSSWKQAAGIVDALYQDKVGIDLSSYEVPTEAPVAANQNEPAAAATVAPAAAPQARPASTATAQDAGLDKGPVVAGDYRQVNGGIYFDHDVHTLDSDALGAVNTVATQLDAPVYDNKAVIVLAETDPSGSAAYNEGLSVRRADSVVTGLHGEAVEQTIRSYGAGERYAIAPDGQRNAADRLGAALSVGLACFVDSSVSNQASHTLIINDDSVVQSYLTVLAQAGIGIDPNGVDGKIGPGSRRSLTAYASAVGLPNASVGAVLNHINASLSNDEFRAQLGAGLTAIRDNGGVSLDAVQAFDVTSIELAQRHGLNLAASLDCGSATPVTVSEGPAPAPIVATPVVVPVEPGVDPEPGVAPAEGETNWRFMSEGSTSLGEDFDAGNIADNSTASLMRDFRLENGDTLSVGGFYGTDHPMLPSDLLPEQHNALTSWGEGFKYSPLSAGPVVGLGATYEMPSEDGDSRTTFSLTAEKPTGTRPSLNGDYINHTPDWVLRGNVAQTWDTGEDASLTAYVGAGILFHDGSKTAFYDTQTTTTTVTEDVVLDLDEEVTPAYDEVVEEAYDEVIPAYDEIVSDPETPGATCEFDWSGDGDSVVCSVHHPEEIIHHPAVIVSHPEVRTPIEDENCVGDPRQNAGGNWVCDSVNETEVTTTEQVPVNRVNEYQAVAGLEYVKGFNNGQTYLNAGASVAAVWNQGGNPGLDGQGAEIHAGVTHQFNETVMGFANASIAGMRYNDNTETLKGRVEAGLEFDLDGNTPYNPQQRGLHDPRFKVGVYHEEDFRTGRDDQGIFAGLTFRF